MKLFTLLLLLLFQIVSESVIGQESFTANAEYISDSQYSFRNLSQLKSKEESNNTLFSLLRQPSPLSEWVGATLAYNFEDEGTDNIIAGAKVKISTVEQFSDTKFNLLVIGNISKITSGVSEKADDDINEIIQSSQGLSVGVAPVFNINPDNENENNFRSFASLNYKINGFQGVGVNEETVNLGQLRLTVGAEFEGFKTNNGGKFNLSAEYIYSYFDEENYDKIFGKSISNISAVEINAIVPLTGNFGFIGGITFSNEAEPVVQTGIIIKASSESEDD